MLGGGGLFRGVLEGWELSWRLCIRVVVELRLELGSLCVAGCSRLAAAEASRTLPVALAQAAQPYHYLLPSPSRFPQHLSPDNCSARDSSQRTPSDQASPDTQTSDARDAQRPQ